MDLKVYSRFELQAMMIRSLIANTGKFSRLVYYGITSIVRQTFYAVSWVLEGLSLDTHIAATKYHLDNANSEDLRLMAVDIGLEIGKKGEVARGKVRFIAPSTSPDSFQVNAESLGIVISKGGVSYYYNPSNNRPAYFRKNENNEVTAIIDFSAVDIGDQYNLDPGIDSYSVQLVRAYPLIESVKIGSDGFNGGHSEDYSDAEIREQITSFYQGLGGGNFSSLVFHAREVPGVVFATAIEDDPSFGEGTLYIADNNGFVNDSVIQAVQSYIEGNGTTELGYRGIGMPLNYKAANRLSAVISYTAQMKNNVSFDEYRELIDAAIINGINNTAFGYNFRISDFVSWASTVDVFDRFTSFNMAAFDSPRYITGVRVLRGSMAAWNGSKLFRYTPASRSISFDNGNFVDIRTGGRFIINGTGGAFVQIDVTPELLPQWYTEEFINQRIVNMSVDHQFEKNEIVRAYQILTELQQG